MNLDDYLKSTLIPTPNNNNNNTTLCIGDGGGDVNNDDSTVIINENDLITINKNDDSSKENKNSSTTTTTKASKQPIKKIKNDNSECSPAKKQKIDNDDSVGQDDDDDDDEEADEGEYATKLSTNENEETTTNDDNNNTNDEDADDDDDDDDDEDFDGMDLFSMIQGSTSNARQLLEHMMPSFVQIPDNLTDFDVYRLIIQLMSNDECVVKRHRLLNYCKFDHVLDLIKSKSRIVVLSGAGCSVSSGIPDFRSRNGIYARLKVDFPDLPDPQAMFDIHYFEHNPKPFFKFAKEIYPGQFKPSLAHHFIRKIETKDKLLRNYTQNIDTLEQIAGIKNVIQCHGSFATARCTNCKHKVNSDYIKEKIFKQEIPYCDVCKQENGIFKPDIVFFGEGLPEQYHKSILDDKNNCDLLIVIGSSLKVKPVANIPYMIKEDVPQILINRESLTHMNFDIELLGDCDVIVKEILCRLGDEWASDVIETNETNKLSLIDDDNHVNQFLSNIEKETENKEKSEATTSTNSVACSSVTVDNGEFQVEETIRVENHEEKTIAKSQDVFISTYLKDQTFLHLKPNMYIFHGAEVTLKQAKKLLNKTNECEDTDAESTKSSSSCSSISSSSSSSGCGSNSCSTSATASSSSTSNATSNTENTTSVSALLSGSTTDANDK